MRKTFEIPLDIPDVTIQTVETDRHGDFVITGKSTVEGTSCHTCGKKMTKVYGEDREITLRHLAILGRKTYILDQCLRHLNGVDWVVNPPQFSHLGNHLINTNRLWHFRKQF